MLNNMLQINIYMMQIKCSLLIYNKKYDIYVLNAISIYLVSKS